ncbi:NAD-dependent dehydratase [Sphingopyxis sp. H038]|uniref:NAD-dependent epimerase/dehydratase family protein n=1 Tax=unclassified Sphingopyxis TaxID=2614943 RepID=UPI000731A47A|nr:MULTISPECIES: NAD-dependent epimerase/dehydratase family protein [unclassified Sphingopyxis]KTE04583.1 NAD-dependent dehydratase [Sphingopyxis sp. H012]KTE13205.1 NAD-dependent dehydratase [Sphingopyxis sp. H053]KTE14393.1 NAD-dependent dehydratase [Sphingopyxis sp. H093]KTE31043.1 NAD-dependent dehydratase [Sphingopyxis sp. H080]KTE37081.1 NAD-dependent dehydratase [Sphingopyxis sp. H038]
MPDALIVGATGLIGRAVIERFGSNPVTVLARREVEGLAAQHKPLVAPSERWTETIAAEKPAVLISCLGTTIRQAGSQAAFRAVDHDLVLAAARGARAGGTPHMITVSSVGAAAKSGNFYLRTKGETEDDLRALGFDRLDLIRPGLLRGDRPGPQRLGEGIATIAAPLTDALLHGSFRRYRSISGATVAAAIAALARQGGSGVHIHENDAIRALAD